MIAGVLAAVTTVWLLVIKPAAEQEKITELYDKAVALYENGDYGEARAIFYAIADYEDALDYYNSIMSLPQTRSTQYSDGAYTYTYEYDDHGNWTKLVETTPMGEHVTECAYEYTVDGKIAKLTEKSLDEFSFVVYEYDANGNAIKRVVTRNGETNTQLNDNTFDAD